MATRKPTPLTRAERTALSTILAKARAFKASYRIGKKKARTSVSSSRRSIQKLPNKKRAKSKKINRRVL